MVSVWADVDWLFTGVAGWMSQQHSATGPDGAGAFAGLESGSLGASVEQWLHFGSAFFSCLSFGCCIDEVVQQGLISTWQQNPGGHARITLQSATTTR
jgi:hypothetical protein